MELTLLMTENQYRDLVRTAEKSQITFTQLISRGISLQEFLLRNDNPQLLLQRGDTIREIVRVQ